MASWKRYGGKVFIKNSNVQTVKKDLMNRNDYDVPPADDGIPQRENELYHDDGIIDPNGVSDDDSDGVYDENDSSIVDGFGDHDETEGHDSRTMGDEVEQPDKGYTELPEDTS